MNLFPEHTRHLYEEEIIRLRRQFHKIPELCYGEEKTADAIEAILKSYGISRVKRVFRTGVVALLGDETKECIAFRMDIDGLPVEEKNEVPYRSEHPGMMHACGHDAHIAILLMTAKLLKEQEDKLPCSVKLIFQPGEEGDGGALPMIEEGVLEHPPVSRIFGAHVWPGVPSGVLEYVNGASFAGCDRYDVKFYGAGGHGAMPEEAKPPILPMSEWILGLKQAEKEETNCVLSACACKADGYYNVFGDYAQIQGTIRTLSETQRTRVFETIKHLTETVQHKYGIPVEFLPVEEYPPFENHESALAEYIKSAIKTVGEENVRKGNPTFAAEDFCYFTKACPGAHIRIGCSNSPETSYPLHNPCFQIAEDCLLRGAELFCTLALNHK